MYVTLSLEEIAVGLVLIALFIALVYTVILLKNLIKTIKYSNDILKNITTISDIAEKRTVDRSRIVEPARQFLTAALQRTAAAGKLHS